MCLNIYKGKQMTYCGKLYNKEMTISFVKKRIYKMWVHLHKLVLP